MKVVENDSPSETKWADIEADDDYDNENINAHHLLNFESAADSRGIKTLISYSTNSRSQSVKITKKVKEYRILKKINKAVFDRKNLVPFNLEEENDGGASFVSVEDIAIELSRNERFHQDDNNDYFHAPVDTNFLRLSRELKLKFKSLKDEETTMDDIEEKEVNSKYVPPSRKDVERRSFDDNTIRITNLSEDIKEKDLTDLFGRVGKIHRAYLAKYKETQSSKGFAFVTYVNKQDAEAAIAKFNRWGINNLLLNVEWAKPSTKER